MDVEVAASTVPPTTISFDVSAIPSDVWIVIFLRYCQNEEAEFHNVHAGPWLLAHVCREWSWICRSTPSLWSTIRLAFSRNPVWTPRLDILQAILETRLAYAANTPLEIYVDGRASWFEYEKPAMYSILDHLLPRHADHIKILHLWFPQDGAVRDPESPLETLLSILSNLPASGFPLLESLKIHVFDRKFVSTRVQTLLSAFRHPPRLQSVSLSRLLPTDAATTSETPSESFTAGVCSLPHLTTLDCRSERNEALGYLHLPKLKNLILRENVSVAQIGSLIGRSGCILQQLTLNCNPSGESFTSFLQMLPNLRDLSLLAVDTPAFSDVITTLQAKQLCPELTSLRLCEAQLFMHVIPFGPNHAVGEEWMSCPARAVILLLLGQIVELLESRWSAGGSEETQQRSFVRIRLNAAHWISNRAMDIDLEMRALVRRVEDLVHAGLDVDVCWRASWRRQHCRPQRETGRLRTQDGVLCRSFLYDAANPIQEREDVRETRQYQRPQLVVANAEDWGPLGSAFSTLHHEFQWALFRSMTHIVAVFALLELVVLHLRLLPTLVALLYGYVLAT